MYVILVVCIDISLQLSLPCTQRVLGKGQAWLPLNAFFVCLPAPFLA